MNNLQDEIEIPFEKQEEEDVVMDAFVENMTDSLFAITNPGNVEVMNNINARICDILNQSKHWQDIQALLNNVNDDEKVEIAKFFHLTEDVANVNQNIMTPELRKLFHALIHEVMESVIDENTLNHDVLRIAMYDYVNKLTGSTNVFHPENPVTLEEYKNTRNILKMLFQSRSHKLALAGVCLGLVSISSSMYLLKKEMEISLDEDSNLSKSSKALIVAGYIINTALTCFAAHVCYVCGTDLAKGYKNSITDSIVM